MPDDMHPDVSKVRLGFGLWAVMQMHEASMCGEGEVQSGDEVVVFFGSRVRGGGRSHAPIRGPILRPAWRSSFQCPPSLCTSRGCTAWRVLNRARF